VEGEGTIKMKDLVIGHKVLAKNNMYEKVYSFGHRDTTEKAHFLQLLPSKLELSQDHMVFVKHKGAIPASMVTVGDILVGGSRVEGIQEVVRTGAFAPFTPSGSIVVNGVLASNYISFQGSNVINFGSEMKTPITYQWVAHAFQAPHRIWCHWLAHTDVLLSNGFSIWSESPFRAANWFSQQGPALKLFLFVPFVFLLLVFYGIETLAFCYPLMGAALIASTLYTRRRRSPKNAVVC
jgi:hypothetical protein